uniref:ATP-binding cassette sub-family B member 6 n=1 Tax=Plectus sambesii TaxID=2011161 RepID=A0A914VW61_9BILA
MQYCEADVKVWDVWVDRGISHCFLDTASSSVLAVWLIGIGSIELVQFGRHGTRLDERLKPKSCLYRLQFLAHLLLSFVFPAAWIFAYWQWNREELYGHHIARGAVQLILWAFALLITHKERHLQMPSPPLWGHGLALLVFWTGNVIERCLAITSFNSRWWWWHIHGEQDRFKLIIFSAEAITVIIAFILGLKAPGLPSLEQRYQFAYGRLPDPESNGAQPSTWSNLWTKMRLMMPYIWPKKSKMLQLRVFVCFALLVIGRVMNVYLPLYYKWIVNSLTNPSPETQEFAFRWDWILIYSALRFCQGNGFLATLRSYLWITVQQYTTREVQVKLYDHLLSLSLRWHIGRKTGEVLQVMDRGTNSINSLLNYVLFNIVPTIADIIIAIAFFITSYNLWFGIIIFVTMALYLATTVYVTEWRTKYRREMNLADNQFRAKGVDSLLNFETVKYYNAEQYEVDRYRAALVSYQHSEWLSSASLSLLNSIQNVIIGAGLLVGSLLCAYLVSNHTDGLTVGDYVLFATYIMQLYTPLNYLGTIYRMIQTALIDMENMFDLMGEKQEIYDHPNAIEYKCSAGKIEFKNVSFRYSPDYPILEDVSFVVQPGKTLAIVGPSGGGKSTIIRLLFRFYDVQSGQILFDDQDVTMLKQRSLRRYIGVVPQDTVLFNDTIRYNIRYGDVEASDAQVEEAAIAVEIHEKILGFPDGYATMVGERGLKLSGGEKQRVAIARTILKAPSFVLLDEATSALDTHTERNIQASLQRICAGRTTVVVAHRLSTVISADEILVLLHGRVAERGTHNDLLALKGVYYGMWMQQQSPEKGDSSATVDEASLTTETDKKIDEK